MIQTTLDAFFGEEPEQEDIDTVLKTLAQPCTLCRLGQCSPNSGLIWKGNVLAPIAIVGDMPNQFDQQARIAFAAAHEVNILDDWLEMAGISQNSVFYTYIVQCQTAKYETKRFDDDGVKIWEQRSVAKDEIHCCFAPRCLRILKALPNLKVVLSLGLDAGKVLLGGELQAKTYHGYWFGSDLLPGVAIFGMPHPREFDDKTGEMKHGRVKQKLDYFRTEFFGRPPAKGNDGVAPRKIMRILEIQETERKENQAA